MTATSSESAHLLDELFAAERRVRDVHDRIVASDHRTLQRELRDAVAAAQTLDDEGERALRLTRVAAILGEMEGDATVDLLIDVLGVDEAEPRRTAGEVLLDHAYDRWKEVAVGVERALERLPEGHLALQELPFLLAEVGEPGVTRLLGRFLAHRDAEAVAAAVEALVELGDPAAVPMLTTLAEDSREVVLEDEDGEESSVSIADLVADALEMLDDAPPEEAPAPQRGPRRR